MLAADNASPIVVAGFVAAAVLLIWLLSRFAGWIVRDVFRLRFGFPPQFPPDPGLDRRRFEWTYLLTSRIGSLVTNNVYGAATEEGLVFEVRIHAVPFMHPVLIPWQALRKGPDRNDILVVDGAGTTVACLSPGRFMKAWHQKLDRVLSHSSV